MKAFGVTFRHGVHPPDSKELTAGVAVRRMPFPSRIALPLRQHAGKPARCLVKKGDQVERGDKIAEAGLTPIASSTVSAPGFDEAELIIEAQANPEGLPQWCAFQYHGVGFRLACVA